MCRKRARTRELSEAAPQVEPAGRDDVSTAGSLMRRAGDVFIKRDRSEPERDFAPGVWGCEIGGRCPASVTESEGWGSPRRVDGALGVRRPAY